ncbi:MAG: lipopolysaccharide assembly protein LapB [Proteobacteria bacterium]|nr:lipopolysaccharide assembly protein LapB [Pseudomonadota bacterium]
MLTESTLLLASLFVIAAAVGWAFATYYPGHKKEPREQKLSASYSKGLNFLLNQQPDKALEVFLRIAEMDTETVATHFALGNLFRRRGEVDRAIRIHENLLKREELSIEHRAHAVLALGDDFMHAGLLDRAEQNFLELRQFELFRETALKRLVSIYELEQEWRRAIETRRELEAGKVGGQAPVIAHYYCELAQLCIDEGQTEKARRRLRRSKQIHKDNPRAMLMRADIALDAKDYQLAIRLYRKLLDRDPEFVAEVLPRLLSCYEATGAAADLDKALRALAKKGLKNRTAIAYAAIMDDILDYPVIKECLREYLAKNDAFREWFAVFQMSSDKIVANPDMLRRVAGILRKTSADGRMYQCNQCGYIGVHLYWKCPSCKKWDTMRPNTSFSIQT